MLGIPPTPLLWPSSFARTRAKSGGKFQLGFAASLASLHGAMKKRGLVRHEYVITSNLALKVNGDPMATGSTYGIDVGIAVYWKAKDKPVRVVACDQFYEPGHNIRALALALDHLRDMERWGCTQLVEHIMQGFALPAGDAAPPPPSEVIVPEPSRDWLRYFSITPSPFALFRSEVEARYAVMAKQYHPDHGGNHELMTQLNSMRDAARRWFDWNDKQRR